MVVLRGSFLGAIFPLWVLVLDLGVSRGRVGGGGSFSLGGLVETLEWVGLGQGGWSCCWSSRLDERSTFLGCFFPVLRLGAVGSAPATPGNLPFDLCPSGTLWPALGLALSLPGLRSPRGSLGSGRDKEGGGLPGLVLTPGAELSGARSRVWPGWELTGTTWLSCWGVTRDLLWGVTLFNHLSSCHLLVDGGSGSGVAVREAPLHSLSLELLSLSESDSELLSDSLELPEAPLE